MVAIKEVLVRIKNEVLGLEKLQAQEKVMGDLNKNTRDAVPENNKLTDSQRKQNSTTKEGTANQKDLLMANLGVMFAGMALQRGMQNLSKTSREWVGTGELMADTMGVVMLPTTIALMENGIIPLSEMLMSLPEGAQKSIGAVALSLEGLGGVMMTGGQLALGINSMIALWAAHGAKLVKVSGIIFSLSGAMTAFSVLIGGTVALAMWNYIDALSEMSIAYQKLGKDAATTNEILGQTGQETRQTVHVLDKAMQAQADAITPESLGISPTGLSQPGPLVTDFGPALDPLPAIKEQTFFQKLIGFQPQGNSQSSQTSNTFNISIPSSEIADFVVSEVNNRVTEATRS